MFTGGFKNMSRSEAKAIAEKNGGKVLGSISKKLDFLIVGASKPTKRKIDQANDLKIKIIFEDFTLAPIDRDLIDKNMLNKNEKKWLNNYHNKVFVTLKNSLNKMEVIELKKACSAF